MPRPVTDQDRAVLLRRQDCQQRRDFLRQAGLGFGMSALASLLRNDTVAAESTDPLSAKSPMFPAKARRIIYLHMIGAPSQLDLFDYKPELIRRNDEACPESFLAGRRFAFLSGPMRLAGSPFKFAQHGVGGQFMSELLPNLASVADQLAIVRSVHSEEINHAPAQMFLHSGFGRGGRPSLGSWVTYGLGCETQNLPAYVVLVTGPLAGAGTSLWANGFLPSVYQGIQFRSEGDPILFLSNPAGQTRDDRRRVLDAVKSLNEQQLADIGDPEIETRIRQYEMAFRMQTSVPELRDLSRESDATMELYGAKPGQPSFASNCILARRLIERGVRVVELYDADWDHHSNIKNSLPAKCRDVDRAMAGLIKDLAQRGLLNDTLVVWGAEFGRTPLRQGADGQGKATNPGRDHHKDAFTVWLAGGGVAGGRSVGRTDEFGFSPVDNPVHVHDLNATILHLLGLDHESLTFKYQGRDFRLTDVEGRIVQELLG